LRGDARGQWLFDTTHADAVSEWALGGVDDGAVVHVTLDRSFVAGGVRWIVDFKTGRHEGADTAVFLDREVERYRAQLNRYARIVRALDSRPIRLGLYYPLVRDGWREWAFEAPGTQAALF
jgi:ATP-dependent helicase/nuclease subunit A